MVIIITYIVLLVQVEGASYALTLKVADYFAFHSCSTKEIMVQMERENTRHQIGQSRTKKGLGNHFYCSPFVAWTQKHC